MSRRDKNLNEGLADHTVGVEISMSSRFLQKINAHLVEVAEKNRSAWIRKACLKLMREEQADLRVEAES